MSASFQRFLLLVIGCGAVVSAAEVHDPKSPIYTVQSTEALAVSLKSRQFPTMTKYRMAKKGSNQCCKPCEGSSYGCWHCSSSAAIGDQLRPVTEDECFEAAKAARSFGDDLLFDPAPEGSLTSGTFIFLPPGCSVKEEGTSAVTKKHTVYYNYKNNGKQDREDGSYIPICEVVNPVPLCKTISDCMEFSEPMDNNVPPEDSQDVTAQDRQIIVYDPQFVADGKRGMCYRIGTGNDGKDLCGEKGWPCSICQWQAPQMTLDPGRNGMVCDADKVAFTKTGVEATMASCRHWCLFNTSMGGSPQAEPSKCVAFSLRNESSGQAWCKGCIEALDDETDEDNVIAYVKSHAFEMVADVGMDGKKCGDLSTDPLQMTLLEFPRVFQRWGQSATTEACNQLCEWDRDCAAWSGVNGSWCFGCSRALDTAQTGAKAWLKQEAGIACGNNCGMCSADGKRCEECKHSMYLSESGDCIKECPPGFVPEGAERTGRKCRECLGESRRRDAMKPAPEDCTSCKDGFVSKVADDGCINVQETCDQDQCEACLKCLQANEGVLKECYKSKVSSSICIDMAKTWCPDFMSTFMRCQAYSMGCYFKILCHSDCVCEPWKKVKCGGDYSGDPSKCDAGSSGLLQVNSSSQADLLSKRTLRKNAEQDALDDVAIGKCGA